VPLPWRRLRQDGVVDLGLRDRVYLVTGGSRGLGRATADALVGDGARVVIGARDPAAVAGAARELGMASAVGVAVDNADPAAPGRLVAGGTVAGTPAAAWRAAFESVFLGAVRLAVGVAAELADGGSIAFVLSTSVRSPIPDLAISNGLRPGLAGVAKTLADELGPRGIRVNGLLPGRVETGRTRELDALRGDPAQVRADLSARIPLRRYGTPEEFGRVAAFVLSPAASYLSGAMIPVDGGALRAL
jgi:3-oxoacyl-[acyl-carrier protein] reductase